MEDKQKCDNMRFLIYRNITMQSGQNLFKKNYDSFKEKSGKKKKGIPRPRKLEDTTDGSCKIQRIKAQHHV